MSLSRLLADMLIIHPDWQILFFEGKLTLDRQ
jgi:hypothetical protein